MPTVAEKRAELEKRRLKAPPPEEAHMFLVTHTRTTVELHPETREALPAQKLEANVEQTGKAINDMLKKRDAGDDRLRNTRIFRLQIDAEGEPTIGPEVRVPVDPGRPERE